MRWLADLVVWVGRVLMGIGCLAMILTAIGLVVVFVIWAMQMGG